MEIVITMAGLGERFKKAGYKVPKYQIEARGKTLFEWSLESLRGYGTEGNTYYFIVRKEDKASEFIKEKCRLLGIVSYRIMELSKRTDGQATTAMLAGEYWKKDAPLLVYNIDTYVEAFEMKSEQLKGDGFIPCFHAPGDHWSFVKLNDNEMAETVAEKERISDNCTLGAYYFKSCSLYEELYREYYAEDEHLSKGEKYIAPLYNYLILKGGEVYISIVPKEKVHVLGTPEELKEFLNEAELS